eukprot:3831948-Amphidinium_carterae.1
MTVLAVCFAGTLCKIAHWLTYMFSVCSLRKLQDLEMNGSASFGRTVSCDVNLMALDSIDYRPMQDDNISDSNL